MGTDRSSPGDLSGSGVQGGVRLAVPGVSGSLLRHYGMVAQRTNPDSGNENGDVEQTHRQLKRAVDQTLILRGSRDSSSREAYASFLREVIERQNLSRRGRIQEDLSTLRALPARRLPDYTTLRAVRPTFRMSACR